MKRTLTHHGFPLITFPASDYSDEPTYTVTVQISSLLEPRIWVGPAEGPRMHLSLHNAHNLRDALTEMIEMLEPEVEGRAEMVDRLEGGGVTTDEALEEILDEADAADGR